MFPIQQPLFEPTGAPVILALVSPAELNRLKDHLNHRMRLSMTQVEGDPGLAVALEDTTCRTQLAIFKLRSEADQKIAHYLAHSGQCPNCSSGSIEGESIEVDGSQAWQKICCLKCGSVWNDQYTLSGLEILEGPDDSQPDTLKGDTDWVDGFNNAQRGLT